jgi:hypothetical protein
VKLSHGWSWYNKKADDIEKIYTIYPYEIAKYYKLFNIEGIVVTGTFYEKECHFGDFNFMIIDNYAISL